MKCTDCNDYETDVWNWMKDHYKIFHPEVKRIDKLFTKAARDNVVGEPCGCNKK